MLPNLSATVVSARHMEDVPSGSAVRAVDGAYWVVPDDAPRFYRCRADGGVLDSIQVYGGREAPHRIPKAEKHDYEAAIVIPWLYRDALIAFGSGSVPQIREQAVLMPFSPHHAIDRCSLTALYARIRREAGIAEKDFNIEGAASNDETILLMNRGTGHLIFFEHRALLAELFDENEPPAAMRIGRVPLPAADSFPPGISGGAFLDDRRLLFCASAEATTDWFHDGEVLGSYIGVADISDPTAPRLLGFAPLLGKDGKAVKDKLEGIDLVREKGGTIYEVIGVVDNDDGTSKLLHIQVENL